MKTKQSAIMALILSALMIMSSAALAFAESTAGSAPASAAGNTAIRTSYTETAGSAADSNDETASASGADSAAADDSGNESGSSADAAEDTADEASGPHEHSFGRWKITVRATYFRQGMKVRTCSCGKTEVKRIPKKKARREWVEEGGAKYYFSSRGKMLRGWNKIRSADTGMLKWYFFNKKGIYCASVSKYTRNKWVWAGGYKFYFNKSRKPEGEGFNFIENKLYYMDRWGAVVYGTFTVDGQEYTTERDGSLTGLAYYQYKYGTFILVDISDQTIWYCRNGKVLLKSDVVTGRRYVHDTPTGIFSVRSKQRNINLIGADYTTFVRYWMAFIGSSHGLHDAPWRSSRQFSNHDTYKYNGSHGCINLRPSFAKKLYYTVSIGTPVIVTQ